MAYKTHYPVKSRGRERVTIEGSFAPAGTGAVTSVKGTGFTVARTDVGEFTVTLDEAFADYDAAWCSLQLNAPGDQIAHIKGAIDVVTAKTFKIGVWDISDAAAADIAANANNRVHFGITVKNTSVGS